MVKMVHFLRGVFYHNNKKIDRWTPEESSRNLNPGRVTLELSSCTPTSSPLALAVTGGQRPPQVNRSGASTAQRARAGALGPDHPPSDPEPGSQPL